MRPKHVPPFVLLILVAVLLLGVAGNRISAGAQEGTSPPSAHPIVGSWSLLLAAGPPSQAPTLATFAADGTLLVTDLALGTGHGAWTPAGERSASFVFVVVRERRDGGFAGTTTFRGTAEVAASNSSWSRSSLEGEEAGPFGGARGEVRYPDAPLQLQAERIAAAPTGAAPPPIAGEPGEALATPVADPTGATPVAAGAGEETGEVVIVLEARPESGAADAQQIEAARAVVARRLDSLGYGDAVVRVDDRSRVAVRVSGVDDPLALATALSRTGLLELVDPQGRYLEAGTVVATTVDGSQAPPAAGHLYETVVDGRDVAEAFVTEDGFGAEVVNFRLRPAAADDLFAFTSDNLGQPLTILLDKRVVSSPTIQSTVGSEGIVTGLAEREVEAVAAQLASGPLPVSLAVVELSLVPSPVGTPAP